MSLSSHSPAPTSTDLADLVDEAAQALTQAHTQGQISLGHGTTNPYDEAAWLVLWSLKLPLDTDIDRHSDPLSEAQRAQARALIAQRIATRQPAAYLTQEAWLQGVPFYVDERAIVPRSLIAEVLADGHIDLWLSSDTRRVLDLCTGNGSLAVLCAMAWPEVEVTALDISPDALEVARINVAKHGLQARVTLGLSDGLQQAPGVFDLIVCNPPYVNAQSMAELPAEFRAEPALALAGGHDGMDFIRHLLRDVTTHLSEHGVLVLEIGHERTHFEAAFPALDVVWLSTSAGDDQVLLVTQQALVAHATQARHA